MTNHLLTGLWVKTTTPNRLGFNPAACGGLKPNTIQIKREETM